MMSIIDENITWDLMLSGRKASFLCELTWCVGVRMRSSFNFLVIGNFILIFPFLRVIGFLLNVLKFIFIEDSIRHHAVSKFTNFFISTPESGIDF